METVYQTETHHYYIKQNNFGQWWPCLSVLSGNGVMCPVIIRNERPFKTRSGAIKFIEKYRQAREVKT